MAAAAGVLTGTFVVLLNYAVHWEEDLLDSLPGPLPRLAPAIAGALIGCLMLARGQDKLERGTDIVSLRASGARPPKDATMAPTRAAAAAITLGGGNSLGPEGPSVEIGANVAVGVGELFMGGRRDQPAEKKRADDEIRQNLLAAGCASGIAAGFNAPVAGLFFALEKVRPEGSGSRQSRALGPSMQLLAAVLAATVSQLGLGSTPAVNLDKVKWEPRDSLWELPLFLILGASVGIAAAALKFANILASKGFTGLEKAGLPRWIFPVLAGLLVTVVSSQGLDEVLYRGFENVNLVLGEVDGDMIRKSVIEIRQEQSPNSPVTVSPLAVETQVGHFSDLLLAKIGLTAVCLASGQVGGLFAPALFMGVSLGGLFGRCLRDYFWSWPLVLGDIHAFSVPVTYAIVGMAASLGAVCGVPLTAVVLLLELSGGDDYGVILPTVAAVGVATYVEDLLTSAMSGADKQKSEASSRPLSSFVNSLERILEVPAQRPDRQESLSEDRPPAGQVRKDASATESADLLQKQLAGGTVSMAASAAFASVQQSDSAQVVIQRLRDCNTDMAVVMSEQGDLLGTLSSESLIRASQEGADLTTASAGELLRALRLEGQALTASPTLPLQEALSLLQDCRSASALLLVEDVKGQQRALGLATLTDIERELRLKDVEAGLQGARIGSSGASMAETATATTR